MRLNDPRLWAAAAAAALPSLLALRADFAGDRVAVFIAGMGGMLNAAFDEKTEFFMLDDLDPQHEATEHIRTLTEGVLVRLS